MHNSVLSNYIDKLLDYVSIDLKQTTLMPSIRHDHNMYIVGKILVRMHPPLYFIAFFPLLVVYMPILIVLLYKFQLYRPADQLSRKKSTFDLKKIRKWLGS
jgi:hypothetical protein